MKFMHLDYMDYRRILLVLIILAFSIIVALWATRPSLKWRINLLAKYPLGDLFWNVLRRGLLSAVYGLGGLHATLIFTFWLTTLGIFAVLVTPLVGLLHGLLVGLTITSMGRTRQVRQSLPFYIVVVLIGMLVYAVADYIVLIVFAPEMDYTPYELAFWCIVWGIWGATVSSRLVKWVRQQQTTDNQAV